MIPMLFATRTALVAWGAVSAAEAAPPAQQQAR
jgi:hypothetical protein